jgi:alanyl-tRNA synthetase
MLFGEKYGDHVRVLEIGDVSRELCGGVHVRTSAEIGAFKILSESSTGAATRRIEAVTSGAAGAYLFERDREAQRLHEELEGERKARSKAERGARSGGGAADDLTEQFEEAATEISGVRVLVADAGELDADSLLSLSDSLKQRGEPAVVVLAAQTDGRVNLVANFSDAVVGSGLDASVVIKSACGAVGGGGGGRPTMARGAGKDAERLGDALEVARKAIADGLG